MIRDQRRRPPCRWSHGCTSHLPKQPSKTRRRIGTCQAEDPDTGACKFYITLSKAPSMDGNFTIFGKVTRGLDVAHKISALPVRNNDPEYPEADRPVDPVVIKKVTILMSEQ